MFVNATLIPKPLTQTPHSPQTPETSRPTLRSRARKSKLQIRTEVSAMFSTTPTTQELPAHEPWTTAPRDTIETRLWLEEHDWLYGLLHSEANASPTFRFPDLISACVSLVFTHDDAALRIFRFLGKELVLRPAQSARRRESMWRTQYELLLALQRSPANRHPN